MACVLPILFLLLVWWLKVKGGNKVFFFIKKIETYFYNGY